MKSPKMHLLVGLCLCAMFADVFAQETPGTAGKVPDKFEFATIVQYGTASLSVSINGKTYSEEKIVLPKGENSSVNSNPILNKVGELQSKGWELVDINMILMQIGFAHFALLRKRIE